jgi:hypothetical protein
MVCKICCKITNFNCLQNENENTKPKNILHPKKITFWKTNYSMQKCYFESLRLHTIMYIFHPHTIYSASYYILSLILYTKPHTIYWASYWILGNKHYYHTVYILYAASNYTAYTVYIASYFCMYTASDYCIYSASYYILSPSHALWMDSSNKHT